MFAVPLGALERFCMYGGDQPIKINVVVKWGSGTNTLEVPLDCKVGGNIPPSPPMTAPLCIVYTFQCYI